MTHVLIAGVSTRAAAASAARAGYWVTTVDGYADRDQDPRVTAIALPRHLGQPFTPSAAAAAATTLPGDAAVFLSNFENAPEAVAALGAGRALWGNPPRVLRRARDPWAMADAFRSRDLPTPQLSRRPSDAPAGPVPDWLLKPLASGGGHGIRRWADGMPIPATHYCQERIDGVAGSVLFVAAAGRACPLGMTRQLIGDRHFHAGPFRYCGNILAPPDDPQFGGGAVLAPRARELADVAAAAFGLTGVNGLDFVAVAGVPYPIEINPRWTAAMELVERAYGVNVFAAHADACARAQLPVDLPPLRHAVGKAIVFARRAVIAGDTDGWMRSPDIADVPHAGSAIAAGSPVCTVFAEAADASGCHAALVARAQAIAATLDHWASTVSTARRGPAAAIGS